MARTPTGTALTAAHRAAQLASQAGDLRGLITLWRGVDATRLGDTIDTFVQAATLLTGQGFDQSSKLAAGYYRLFRTAEGVGGAMPVVALAQRPGIEIAAGHIRGAALSGIIDARKAGQSVERAQSSGLVRVIAQVSKMILTGGRMTLTNTVADDRRALGWARTTSGDPCPFCRMLSGRGAVYKTEKSADFETHGGCGCSVEPLYAGSDLPQSDVHEAEFKAAQIWAHQSGNLASKGTSADALNNFRRYLAAGTPTAANAGNGGNPE